VSPGQEEGVTKIRQRAKLIGRYIGYVLFSVLSLVAGYGYAVLQRQLNDVRATLELQPLTTLIFTSVLMGLFICFPVMFDFFNDLLQDQRLVGAISLVCLAVLISIIYVSFGVFVSIMSWIGIFLTSLSISTFLREKIWPDVPKGWTAAQIWGMGLVPFYTGFLMFLSKYGSALLSRAPLTTTLTLLFSSVGVAAVTVLVGFLASHRWLEEQAETKPVAPGLFVDDRVKQIQQVRQMKDGDETSEVRFLRRVLRYYFWVCVLFPITIALVYYVADVDGIFLISAYVAYLVVLGVLFDYPGRLASKRGIAWATSARISAVFLLLGGIAVEHAVGLSAVSGFAATSEELLSWLPQIGFIVLALAILAIFGMIFTVVDLPLFYRRRLVYVIASAAILGGVYSIAGTSPSIPPVTHAQLQLFSHYTFIPVILTLLFAFGYVLLVWMGRIRPPGINR